MKDKLLSCLRIARGGNPDPFEKPATASVQCDRGASVLRVKSATAVVAVRLEFDGGPAGFNVPREIGLLEAR